MTLSWPWPILCQGQIWLHRLLYGRKRKLFIFGTYCSLRSQSCLKHSAKWVNEVEWVWMVTVILWPWSKVTQISKLNVWLLACILRWAIQGFMALLFLFSIVYSFALFYFSKKLLTTARPRYDFCIVVLFFPPLDFEYFLFCLFFPAASSRLWQHTCRHKWQNW